MHDNQMPKGWHLIKSVLLKEMRTAGTFHLCMEAAGALFHARLIGEQISQKHGTESDGGQIAGAQSETAMMGKPA